MSDSTAKSDAQRAVDAGLRLFCVDVTMTISVVVLAVDAVQARAVAEENAGEEVAGQGGFDGQAGEPEEVKTKRGIPSEWRDGGLPYAPKGFVHDSEVEDFLPPAEEAREEASKVKLPKKDNIGCDCGTCWICAGGSL